MYLEGLRVQMMPGKKWRESLNESESEIQIDLKSEHGEQKRDIEIEHQAWFHT